MICICLPLHYLPPHCNVSDIWTSHICLILYYICRNKNTDWDIEGGQKNKGKKKEGGEERRGKVKENKKLGKWEGRERKGERRNEEEDEESRNE